MSFVENENEIIDVVTLRRLKSRGAGTIYISPELLNKIDIPLDSNLSFRYDKEKKEICIKLQQY
jgi:hypothetical protein